MQFPINGTEAERKEAKKQVKAWLDRLTKEARNLLSDFDIQALESTVCWAIVRTKDEDPED